MQTIEQKRKTVVHYIVNVLNEVDCLPNDPSIVNCLSKNLDDDTLLSQELLNKLTNGGLEMMQGVWLNADQPNKVIAFDNAAKKWAIEHIKE